MEEIVLTSNQKTATVFARSFWLVKQIVEQYGDAVDDVTRVIIETMIAIVDCTVCGLYTRNADMNQIGVCWPCREYDYNKVHYKQTHMLLETYVYFLVCRKCLCELVTCYKCDYATCHSEYEDATDECLVTLATYQCDSTEKMMLACSKCVNVLCYPCRLKYGKSAESDDDLPCSVDFLCPECSENERKKKIFYFVYQ